MRETVAVTGASGFIGRELVKRLVLEGFSVRALQRKSQENRQPAVEYRSIGDIGEDVNFGAAISGAAVVVHLAARVHKMNEHSADSFKAYEKINTTASRRLAQAAAQSKVKRFVYLSTVKVNGAVTVESPFSESDRPCPSGPYANSKWKAELGLHEISRESGLEVVILRPPLVYGPGVKGNFLLLMKLVNKVAMLPLGGLGNRRSMVGLGNLTDMIIRCVTHPKAAGETFFVSDGRDVSVTELIRLIAGALQRRSILLPVPKQILKVLARFAGKQGEFSRLAESLQIDITKAKRLLDWMPPNSVEAEIARTASWYRQEMEQKKD